ncbi:Alpha/Beta hydrolase protein [Syncephalis plumigaleata]|nr:Alpha/Beta hydrolase protein [Syncephalis plumigaleata]
MLSSRIGNGSLRDHALSIYRQYIHDSPLLNPYQIDYTRDVHRGMVKEALQALPKQLMVFNPAQVTMAIMDYLRNGPAQPSWTLHTHVIVYLLRNLLTNGIGTICERQEVGSFRAVTDGISAMPTPWRAKTKDVYVDESYRRKAIKFIAGLGVDVSLVKQPSRTDDCDLGCVDETLPPLHGEWIRWVENDEDMDDTSISAPGVVLHLHGGAFIIGSSASHRPMAWRLARDTGSPVLLLNYRLAPEHAYPSALVDALACYLWLTDTTPQGAGYHHEQLVLGGDSAGLAAALLCMLRDGNLRQPAGAYLWSPWLDLTHSSDSWRTNNVGDYIPDPDNMNIMRVQPFDGRDHFYVKSLDLLRNPYVSPLFGNYENLPPLLVQTGTAERLFDECVQCAKKHRAANRNKDVPTRLEIYEEMPHVWQALTHLPMAKEATQRTSLFILDVWQRASTGNNNGANLNNKMKDWHLNIDINGKAKATAW